MGGGMDGPARILLTLLLAFRAPITAASTRTPQPGVGRGDWTPIQGWQAVVGLKDIQRQHSGLCRATTMSFLELVGSVDPRGVGGPRRQSILLISSLLSAAV